MKTGTFVCMYSLRDMKVSVPLSASTVFCSAKWISVTLVNMNNLYNLYYSGLVTPQHESESNLCVEAVWLPFWLASETMYKFCHHFIWIKFQSNVNGLCKQSKWMQPLLSDENNTPFYIWWSNMHYYRKYFLIAGPRAAEQGASSVIMQQWCSAPYSEQCMIKTTLCCVSALSLFGTF